MITAIRRPAFAIPCIAGLPLGIAAAHAAFTAFAAIELESRGSRDSAHVAAICFTTRPTGSRS
jgi:hypothetical protein